MIKGLSLLPLAIISCFKLVCLNLVLTRLLKTLKRNSTHQKNLFFFEMSTTRSQKRKNIQQENSENVSGGFSRIVVENTCFSAQDVSTAGPSKPKSPRIENSLLESLRASLKEEITSEIKNLLIEFQKGNDETLET